MTSLEWLSTSHLNISGGLGTNPSFIQIQIHSGNESELVENTAQEWSVRDLTEDHLVLVL